MFSLVTNQVQALMWITAAALLFAVWLHTRATSSGTDFGLAYNWQYVTESLRIVWLVLGISLLVTVVWFALPNLATAEQAPICSPLPNNAVTEPGPYTDVVPPCVTAQVARPHLYSEWNLPNPAVAANTDLPIDSSAVRYPYASPYGGQGLGTFGYGTNTGMVGITP